MTEQFDVIVIGMGPGGEVTSSQLLQAGKRVAVVERELIGGECAYWACIPSKTLLRPPEAKGEVDRAAGVDGARLDWPSTRDYRDSMVRNLDDSNQVKGYRKSGATVIKGAARITGPGTVDVAGRTLSRRAPRCRHRLGRGGPAHRGLGRGAGLDQPGSHHADRDPEPGGDDRG